MKKIMMIISMLVITAILSGCISVAIPGLLRNELSQEKDAERAFTDAKNTLAIYIAGNSRGDGMEVVGDGSVFEVELGGKNWYYTYAGNGIAPNEDVNTKPTLPESYEIITYEEVGNIPSNVTIYLVEPDSVRALSDAKNALSIYIADMSDGSGAEVIGDGSVFEVELGGKNWYFIYSYNGLTRNRSVNTKPTLPESYDVITYEEVENIPSNVTIYLVEPD
ncbi:MAG: hypothetical protein IJO93_04225 [Clostridia bacterium]|nr:hypothetical protein [Clostridia bacterium]